MLHPFFKVIFKRIGNIIAVAGLIFVALRLYEHGETVDFAQIDLKRWLVVLGMVLVYGVASFMLAFAWRELLSQFGVDVSRGWAFRVYGVSQIAKYVPGNVFHLAGRQSMGMSSGVAAVPLLKSSIWELCLIAGTGSLFGVLALPHLFQLVSINTAVVIFIVSCVLVGLCLFYVSLFLGRTFCWHLFFLSVAGMIFVGLLHLFADVAVPWSLLCGSYVLAWLIGLITPGAPAGVGVRELVLLFLLRGLVSESDLIFAVLMGRIVTVGGDIVFFVVSALSSAIPYKIKYLDVKFWFKLKNLCPRIGRHLPGC